MTDTENKMSSERPSCPKCTGFQTRSKGGASRQKYYYTCKVCKAEWMQFPPASAHVKEGGDVEVTFKKFKQAAKSYSCSRCGATPKKGHICPHNPKSRAIVAAAKSLLNIPIPLPLPMPSSSPLPSLPLPSDLGTIPLVPSDSDRSLEPS